MAEHGGIAVNGGLGCCSGGFDPDHIGHKRLLRGSVFVCHQMAKGLLIILTRDDQLLCKKNRIYMTFGERKESLEFILEGKGIPFEIVPNIDSDLTSRESLRYYRPSLFLKGGGSWNEQNLPEMPICRELGIRVIFGVGGFNKVRNSSDAQEIDKEDVI